MKATVIFAALGAMLVSGIAAANYTTNSLSYAKRMASSRRVLVQQISRDNTIVSAIRAQNAKRMPLDKIKSMDAAWIADAKYPLRKEIINNQCSKRLRQLIATDSLIVEAFLMDDQGALVCASEETSDYWQGDEAKWKRTFGEKKPKFVDHPQLDDSTKVFASQFSVLVRDTKGGAPIGALTLTMRFSAGSVPTASR